MILQKKHGYRIISLIMCCVMLMFTASPSVSALSGSDFGASVQENKTYFKDGKFWYSFYLYANDVFYDVEYTVKLYNSNKKEVVSWSTYEVSAGTKETRNYGYDFSKLPTDTYTYKVMATSPGYWWLYGLGSKYVYWTFTVDHVNDNIAPTISFKSAEPVTMNDGAPGLKFTFSQQNGKGKNLTFEIYDSNSKKIYSKTSGTLNYVSGTNWMTWNYYPSDGGLKAKSGTYTVKYWITGGNPKESTFSINP